MTDDSKDIALDLVEDLNGSQITCFVGLITALAIRDHRSGPKRRTGEWLCQEFAGDGYRKGHLRLASSVYTKVRWSMEIAEKESIDDA